MFGKHKAIERFSIIFLILAILMTALTGSIVFRKKASDKERLSNQAIYTTETVFSRSGVGGNVVSVSTSKDKTKAFLLLHLEDMSTLSVNAEDYIMFLCGSSQEGAWNDMIAKPSGGLYMFGSTGYVGVYLQNHEPFQSQILNLVIRGVKDFSSSEAVGSVPSNGDSSFEDYDQMQVFFNPGAGEAQAAEFLDADKVDVKKMYEEVIVAPQREAIKETLRADLVAMFDSLRLMNQYSERLTSGVNGGEEYKLQPPEVPAEIDGDVIKAITYEKGDELEWSDSSNGWVDLSGNKYEPDKYYLEYTPDFVFSGGYDFEWQSGKMDGKYLDEMRGSLTPSQFIKEKDSEMSASESVYNDADAEWFYLDGSDFVIDTENEMDSKVVNISKDIERLTAAWNNYYEQKHQYQCVDLRSMLMLEVDLDTITSVYSDNFGDKVLTNY